MSTGQGPSGEAGERAVGRRDAAAQRNRELRERAGGHQSPEAAEEAVLAARVRADAAEQSAIEAHRSAATAHERAAEAHDQAAERSSGETRERHLERARALREEAEEELRAIRPSDSG